MAQTVWIGIAAASKRTGIPKLTLRHRCVAGTIKARKTARGDWEVPLSAIEAMPTSTGFSPDFEFDPEEARRLRKAAGWSPERAAEELGISLGTLRRWERGATRPGAGTGPNRYGAAQQYEELIKRWAASVPHQPIPTA